MITDYIEKYIDLKIEEAKLKSADALSNVLSIFVVAIIVVIIFAAILVFLAIILMQWLNKPDVLGEPWGTVIAGAPLISLVIILALNRSRMFRKPFYKVFTQSLKVNSTDIDKDLARVEGELKQLKESSVVNPVAAISGIYCFVKNIFERKR